MQETLLTLPLSHHEDIHIRAKKKKPQQHHHKPGSDNSHPTRVSRRVSPAVSPSSGGEKSLPNGDIYSGALSGNAPHGTGKYLWSDGCMYEGEWRKGKACGKGRKSPYALYREDISSFESGEIYDHADALALSSFMIFQ